jgi:hypothetical protein
MLEYLEDFDRSSSIDPQTTSSQGVGKVTGVRNVGASGDGDALISSSQDSADNLISKHGSVSTTTTHSVSAAPSDAELSVPVDYGHGDAGGGDNGAGARSRPTVE